MTNVRGSTASALSRLKLEYSLQAANYRLKPELQPSHLEDLPVTEHYCQSKTFRPVRSRTKIWLPDTARCAQESVATVR